MSSSSDMSSSSEDTGLMDMDDYFDFLEIPIEDIELATNNFSDENQITESQSQSPTSSSKLYKGQLMKSSGEPINIVVRKGSLQAHTMNEIYLSRFKHKNIVSTYKVSATEDRELVIVNKDEGSERLDRHLSGSTLTWIQRLKICVGVADALSYLHFDAEVSHSVIHCDIKSSNIILDRNWEPKLKGFRYAVRTKKHHLQLISKYNGALQYMNPAYEKTKGLTHKSDVFSFGVVLFEVLFGREASISVSDEDNWCFVRLAKLHYEKKTLDEMIDPDLRKQMNLESFNIFSDTAYCCLMEQRAQRLNMTQILRRLERALELQHTHEHSTAVVEGRSPCLKGRNLDHLKFRLSDIELATNKFSKTHCIGSGGYGMVYKAKLDHYDDLNSSLIEGKNIDGIPKKNSTVAIKRIFSRVDGQGEQGFIAEIEMLSNCKHPNVVSLLGFCNEGPEMILVYEFCPNGSLDEYLGNTDNITNLTWAQRIQISIDIAHGLKYLHTSTECRDSIIHRDIKSANILLDENWVAKIADFGLSKLHHACQQGSTLVTYNIAGTELYLDPEYLSTGKLKTKSDIYSFGVVLFEIMCGKLAYDKSYNEKGLPSVARQCFSEGTINKLVDPKIKEADENISLLNGGVNQDSLETFSKIAYQCVAETQSERPTMEVIIKELEKALNFQKNSKDNLHMSLKALTLGTQDFSESNCIGEGRLWKLYHGELPNANGHTTIVAKRWGGKSRQGHHQFLTELEILFKYKHKNIIGLAGYCNEMDEKIIVYEHASNGRLDKHLDDASLTWTKRLKICIDIASGLGFLHEGGAEKEESMKHTDIKSSCILLDGDWNAKITNLELSRKILELETVDHATDNGSLGYIDPLYHKEGFLTLGSDIYSLGVVLLEMLCGRLAWGEGCEDHSQSLGPLAQRHYEEHDNLEELVFPGIRDQIVPQSLNVFQKIAIQCLDDDRCSRPLEAARLIRKLKKALEFQEDHEIWEPKLPQDYKEILQMSETPEIYNDKKKKELNDILIEGVLLQEGKLWLSLSNTGERNETISAKMFSYENRKTYKRRSIKKSRFKTAVKMLDISNLNLQIKIKTQFLSPNVIYGAHLVFKFCDPRKISNQPRYVNLKYKMGGKSLHAYFATQMDNEWMMIELCRFLNNKKDTDFEVLIESLSRYYCGSDAIYVEGIEFRVVDNVKPEEIERIKEFQQVFKLGSNIDQEQQSPVSYCDESFENSENDGNSEKMLSLNEVNGKKQLVLPAKEILYKYPNVKVFQLNSTVDSRFQEVIEILPQQVFGIKCKIQSHMLSRDAKYLCYLVFKLSEECHGLHCPVKVRNLLDRKKKETGIIYFRSPSPWNLQNINGVPKQREDGLMEVNVWEVNSNELINGCVGVNLKLISYEGTMSGLVVSGLEFRPV